jgi:hypothetical protein
MPRRRNRDRPMTARLTRVRNSLNYSIDRLARDFAEDGELVERDDDGAILLRGGGAGDGRHGRLAHHDGSARAGRRAGARARALARAASRRRLRLGGRPSSQARPRTAALTRSRHGSVAGHPVRKAGVLRG